MISPAAAVNIIVQPAVPRPCWSYRSSPPEPMISVPPLTQSIQQLPPELMVTLAAAVDVIVVRITAETEGYE